MKMFQCLAIATTILLALFAASQAQDSDDLVLALQDEMQRSLAELKTEEGESEEIYFVSYRVFETKYVTNNYELGARVSTRRSGDRILQVDLRIGSYEEDQTNFAGGRGASNFVYQGSIPLDDDYDEIRRVAWRLTDAAFKNRVNVYAQKQTALASQSTSEEREPDFTREEPYEFKSQHQFSDDSFVAVADAGKELSALFLDTPDIYSSEVSITATNRRVLFLNSEGSHSDINEQQCEIFTTAMTQNENGQELRDFRTHYSIDCSNFPDMETMKSDVQGMMSSLQTMRVASELEDVYFGPIMFEGQAAAQFWKSYLVAKLAANRLPMTANPGQFRGGRNSFLDRIGARIVSADIDVVNDPTLREYGDLPLIGSYPVDLEGIPAQRTLLIEGGRLQTMLTTRTPVDDFRKSTGSQRIVGRFGGTAGVPGNVLIEPKAGLAHEDMMEELWQLLVDFNVDFGVVVRQISSPVAISGNSRGLANVMEAYKVYPDGREEMLAPVELLDITDRTLRDIVAVSSDLTQFNTTYFNRIGTNTVPISIVAPSFIIEELGVRKVQGSGTLPPLVPHPYASPSTIGN